MRIVIKFGSALISKNGCLDYEWIQRKVDEIAALHQNNEVLLVTSGAVAAGMEIMGLMERPTDTTELQMLSGIGQIRLVKRYKDLFLKKEIHIAQLLLTHHNFASAKEVRTLKKMIAFCLEHRVIPVINENDMINKEELEHKRSFSDNDILSALVAYHLEADLAVLLTDVDGLYNANPKDNPEARLLEEITAVDKNIKKMASRAKSKLGLGGMGSKLRAAEICLRHGIDLIVANGDYSLLDIIDGKVQRSLFHGSKKS